MPHIHMTSEDRTAHIIDKIDSDIFDFDTENHFDFDDDDINLMRSPHINNWDL